MSARRARRSEYTDPWWVREIGGMPGWLIVAVGAVILTIATFAILRLA